MRGVFVRPMEINRSGEKFACPFGASQRGLG